MDKKARPAGPSGKEVTEVNPFRTCDANGKPVMFRFSSARSLRDVFDKAKMDDTQDALRRSKILGMYEGKLPWDPKKLEALGIKDKANFNINELLGQIDARAGAITNLALDTTDLVELRPHDAEIAGTDTERIGRVVADEFSRTLRETVEFLPSLSTMAKECDLFGFGPCMWPDPVSYRPQALLRGNVKLYTDAPHLASRNELIMVEATLPAAYVFGLFDNTAASAAMGWNLDVLKKYAVHAFCNNADTSPTGGDVHGTSTPESLIMQARENRIFETRQFEPMRVIHAFVREVSGERKVSHYIIPAVSAVDGFLLVRYGLYESMDQCCTWLPYKMTECKAAALRGLASFLAPVAEAKNKRMCELMDSSDHLMRIYLQRSNGGSNERLTMYEQGRYAVLPQDVVASKSPIDPNGISQAAQIIETVSRATVGNALGVTGAGPVSSRVYKGADRKTKEEVIAERQDGEKSEQNLFVSRVVIFDAIVQETFRRFMNLVNKPSLSAGHPEIAKFIRRCKARNVTKTHLREVSSNFEVYMCRDVVTGGAGAKAGLLADVLGLGGNLDEKGRIDATREYIRCRMGTQYADRFRPIIGRDDMPSDSASHATVENNDMLELSAVLAAPDQMHWSHIPVHFNILKQISDAVQNGQVEDPQKMLDLMQLASEHIQTHLQYGGRQIGKEDDAKAILRDIRSLRPIQKSLEMMAQTIERANRAQEEQQQKDMEELQARADGKEMAVKEKEIDVKAALEMRKQDLAQQVNLAKAGASAQTDMFRAKNKAEIDRISAATRRYIQAATITGNRPPLSESSLANPEEL